MSNYAEYNFASNIKVKIDECRGAWKLDFDPGDGDSGWWINLSDLDGEHDCNKGELKQFPLYTTKEYCDKFIKAVEIIVNKFIEVGYIKQEKEEENMFNGLNGNVESIIYDFNGCTVKVSRTDVDDKFAINIDPGNYDLFNPYTRETSEYSNLECRLEVRGGIGHWYIERPICDDVFDSGFIRNGERFKANQINVILNAVKSSVDFIQAHGGSIRNVVEEITHIGKMTLKSKKIEDNVYMCSIEGMKASNNVNAYWRDDEIYCVAFTSGEFTINNYKGEHATMLLTGKHFKFSLYNDEYRRGYVQIKSFKVTEAELKELKELLQKCSDRLHKFNEPAQSAPCDKEKMTIKVTPIDNDMVTLEITGMGDPMEFRFDTTYRARYRKCDNSILITDKNNEYVIPNGCTTINCMWICIGKEYPMTKSAAQEIITILGASAAKLHAIKHEGAAYTLVL